MHHPKFDDVWVNLVPEDRLTYDGDVVTPYEDRGPGTLLVVSWAGVEW